MYVRAKNAPASGGGFTWDDTEQIREVPDAIGHELVHVAGGAVFAEILPSELEATDPEPAKPVNAAASRRGKAIEE